MGFALSCLALLVTYKMARRSLVYGIVSVLTAGYVFGIIRANIPQFTSYFIFDAAVVGLYAAQIRQITEPFFTLDGQRLKHWVVFLILWPILLFFVPLQDPLVQTVGLRGNMFLLPFIIIGARLDKDQIYDLALAMSILNLGAFVLGVLQYTIGLEHFVPRNSVTEIIYNSNDVGSMYAFRIPSMFSTAHSYAAMMVISLPWVAGAWIQRHRNTWQKNLLLAGILAAMLGVFMSAVRNQFVVLLVLITVFTFSTRLRPVYRVAWVVVLVVVAYVVSTNERMQRFATLEDTEYVVQRVHGSINSNLITAITTFPFGNGLGGGGTSIPYFLAGRVDRPIAVESEFARIHLETGLIGLAAWLCFGFWVFTRPGPRSHDPWLLGIRLAKFVCLSFAGISLIGIGLFTSIPSTILFLMLLGWIATHHTGEADARSHALKQGYLVPRFFDPRLLSPYFTRDISQKGASRI